MNDVIFVSVVDDKIDYKGNLALNKSGAGIEIPITLIPERLHPYTNLFAIKIKGDPAIAALLMPGDFVVLTKLNNKSPRNGDFIGLIIESKLNFFYFFKEKSAYRLQPANSTLRPVYIDKSQELSIIGQVVLVLRNVNEILSSEGNVQATLHKDSLSHIEDSQPSHVDKPETQKIRIPASYENIQKTMQGKRRLIVLRILSTFLIVIVLGWAFQNFINIKWPDWTGFQQKKFWDWLELLVIPIVLSFGLFFLNQSQKLNEQRKLDELARENSLQQYLDKMTELLLDNRHRALKKTSKERHMARTRTLTVLRSLDQERKGIIIRFLYEANLIVGNGDQTTIELIDGDLSYANLSTSYMSEINLNGANLFFADLHNSDLSNSFMQSSILYGANLTKANLAGADLSFANLENANLTDVDLTEADLSEARVTIKQLKKAKSIKSATLPKDFLKLL